MHRLKTWQLFAICVLTWGTTWYAITYQIGTASPEASVALRFALAGSVLLGFCALRGERLNYTPREHGLLALQGCFMYGVSYLCVYHAEKHIVSGLVAVGYSASPLVAGLGARALFGTPTGARFVGGGLLGLCGVALIFWPEFARATGDERTALGALFTGGSVLLSAVGSLTASRNRVNGLPFWPALGYGMLYGAAISVVFAVALGAPLTLPATVSWWTSLLYLSLAGSVLTFACFLTLQERIGPGPAATVGVMTPLLALVVSIAFEGLRPDWLTLVGAALAVVGNAMMLRRA
ncbi:MAG TPA: DMT family transporter [Steroidobacteraceae bacterium]|nr:DMT family transporter [Steroidobacteraceae bacterium]